MKRFAILPLLLVALIASGCGSSSSSSNDLGTALSYMPKDSPIVIALDTNADGGQWQQVDKLIGKFPGGGQIKQQLKSTLSARLHLDFDKDIKPLLGNDLVISTTGQSSPGIQTPYVAAWKVKDEGAAQKLIQQGSSKAGTVQGSDYYGTGTSNFTVVKDGVLVIADTKEALSAALGRAKGGDHLTEQDFNDALGDLDKNALLRVTGNFQALLAKSPAGPAARKVKWVAALRNFGVTVGAEPDGIKWGFNANTPGGLTERDLPLASGPQSAAVVRRSGEVGFGVRNPAQIYAFGRAVSQITDPAGYARFNRRKAKASKQLGVSVDRDLIGQLTGDASFSVSLAGDFAMRADLRDPAAAVATLKKAAPGLLKLAKGNVSLVKPKNGKGFYALGRADGKKIAFGVVGKSFVVASDAARAAQFAGQSPSRLPGAKGALVLASDARSLANAAAAQRGQGVAAQFLTGSLGDLIGSVEAERSGITGTLKLFVR